MKKYVKKNFVVGGMWKLLMIYILIYVLYVIVNIFWL